MLALKLDLQSGSVFQFFCPDHIRVFWQLQFCYLWVLSSSCSSSDATRTSRRDLSFTASSSSFLASSSSAWYIALICDVSLPHLAFSFSSSSDSLRFCASRNRTCDSQTPASRCLTSIHSRALRDGDGHGLSPWYFGNHPLTYFQTMFGPQVGGGLPY